MKLEKIYYFFFGLSFAVGALLALGRSPGECIAFIEVGTPVCGPDADKFAKIWIPLSVVISIFCFRLAFTLGKDKKTE